MANAKPLRALPDAASPVYYVYMLLDQRHTGTFKYGRHTFDAKPLYCGMGYNGRAEVHARKAKANPDNKSQKNIRIRNIIKATGAPPPVVYVKRGLTQQEAFDLERKLIVKIGRLQLGTGPLTNLSDGGEGQKNVVHTPEYRAMRSAQHKAWWAERTDEEIQNMVSKLQKSRAAWTSEEREKFKKKQGEALRKALAIETPEQKKARSNAYRKTCAARTAEERAALSAILSGSRKRFLDSLSDVEYFDFHAKGTLSRNETWNSLSAKERKVILEKRGAGIQEHWDGLSAGDRKAFSIKVSEALQALPEHKKIKRNRNISKALKKTYAADPTIKQRAAKANSETRASWTSKEKREYADKVAAGKAAMSDEAKAKASKRMSKSGKARIEAMTPKEKKALGKKLAKSIKASWDAVPEDQRAARAIKAHKSRDNVAIGKKISGSVARVHAERTPKERAAIAEKIRQRALARPPEVLQRLAAGNTLRGMMKRAGLPNDHKVKAKLNELIAQTPWNGSARMTERFNVLAQTLINRYA